MSLSVVQRCGVVASLLYALVSLGGSTETIEKAAFEAGYLRASNCFLHMNETVETRSSACRDISTKAEAEERRLLWFQALMRLAVSLGGYWLLGYVAVRTARWISAGARRT